MYVLYLNDENTCKSNGLSFQIQPHIGKMDLINILTLYKSLFITYIDSNIFIIIDKCLLASGYTLTTSSDNATVGLDFTFTCVTTETVIIFTRNSTTVCIMTGGNSDGTCVFTGGCITDYTYACNPTTNTYTVTIPGSYRTGSLHRTTGNVIIHLEEEDQVLRYFMLMVSYYLLFSHFFVITTLVDIVIPRQVPKLL